MGERLLSRRDGAIVAWHEVPGKHPPKEPSRRVRSDCNDEVSDAKTEEIYVFRKGSITSKSSSNINTERAFDEADLRD